MDLGTIWTGTRSCRRRPNPWGGAGPPLKEEEAAWNLQVQKGGRPMLKSWTCSSPRPWSRLLKLKISQTQRTPPTQKMRPRQNKKNFEHLNIGADGDSELVQSRKEQLSEPKLCVKWNFNQYESYLISKIIKLTKNTKTDHYMPILVGEMKCSLGKAKFHSLKILLDSGASSYILPGKHTQNMRNKKTTPVWWKTQRG